jgi:hypothetical protein
MFPDSCKRVWQGAYLAWRFATVNDIRVLFAMEKREMVLKIIW